MAKEAALKKEEGQEYPRDTIDSERRKEADNYRFPPTSANDNESRNYSSPTGIKNIRTVSTTTTRRAAKKTAVPVVSRAESRKLFSRWRVFGQVSFATSFIYPIQIFFAVISFIGFAAMSGIEADWVLSALNTVSFDTLDEAGGGLFVVGMVGAFLCGFISFLVATAMYISLGYNILHNFSLLILTLCLAGLLFPILNLFPLMLLWYLYFVFSK
ncbi:MAG: hypothetical protein WDZ56_00175 [Candidatus Paceibacterota bacterium]